MTGPEGATMIRYQDLQRRSGKLFRSLTGMDFHAFEALFADLEAAHRAARAASAQTRDGRPRRRAPGGGRRHALAPRDRLLMALFWLRAYPTYEILGFLFGLDKANAHRNTADVLVVLETLGDFPFDRPDHDPNRTPLGSAEAIMDAFPAVRLVIDTKEQRTRRPRGKHEVQKPYYSMKKKAHTLKTQIAVRPDGRIESVGESVPGGSKHDKTLLLESGLLDRLGEGQVAMADKAYENIRAKDPAAPLITPQPARRNHPLTEHQKMANRFIARYRIVVEHTIAQVNRYTVLRQVYRGSRSRHTRVVRVVAMVVNRRIEVVPLKVYGAAA
jgi:DDE superfamily endonuclease/Helix-turn-helix of DDE superfamily endonuclease